MPALTILGDAQNAEPYNGQTLRVDRISLNDSESMEKIIRGFDLVTAFSLHPDFGIKAVDGKGCIYSDNTPILVVKRKQPLKDYRLEVPPNPIPYPPRE